MDAHHHEGGKREGETKPNKTPQNEIPHSQATHCGAFQTGSKPADVACCSECCSSFLWKRRTRPKFVGSLFPDGSGGLRPQGIVPCHVPLVGDVVLLGFLVEPVWRGCGHGRGT
jgi:hypothetical protein